MKRLSLAVAGTAILFSGFGTAQAVSVGDLAVSATSAPETVSPPGGIAVHRITVVNNGPAAAPAQFSFSSTGGASYVALSSQLPNSCIAPIEGEVDPTFTCDFGIVFPNSLGGQAIELKVALKTPATEGPISSTSVVSVPPTETAIVDDQPDNNTATQETQVTASTEGASALVPVGGSLAFGKHVFRTRVSQNGVIVFLSNVAAGGDATECGGVPCGAGLKVDFDTDPHFQGSGVIEIQFGKRDGCRGYGDPAQCDQLFARKNGSTFLLPTCVLPSDNLCVESVIKISAAFRWTVRVDSTDPEFIPPLPRSSS